MNTIELKFTRTTNDIEPTDIGFVLSKHPDSVFRRSYDTVDVEGWYTERTEGSITFFLCARDRKNKESVKTYVSTQIVQLMSKIFNSALNKTEHPAALAPWSVEIKLPAVKIYNPKRIEEFCEPLGWTVSVPLIESPIESCRGVPVATVHLLHSSITVQECLSQLVVLIPAAVGSRTITTQDGVNVVFRRGGDWLLDHPHWLKILRGLIRNPKLLRVHTKKTAKHSDNDNDSSAKQPTLYQARAQFVADQILKYKARRILDLGCASGKLCQAVKPLLGDYVKNVLWVGIDKNPRAIARAKSISGFTGILGNLWNPPKELRFSWDMVLCVEVIEHFARTTTPKWQELFSALNTKCVVLTTPNAEYNRFYENLSGNFRDKDHRWEAPASEWKSIVHEVAPRRWKYELHNIGENRNGITPTQAATLTPTWLSRVLPKRSTLPAPLDFSTTRDGLWACHNRKALQMALIQFLEADERFPLVPETVSSAGSTDSRYVETVESALRFYRQAGVESVFLEEKHMGTRAICHLDVSRETVTFWSRAGRRFMSSYTERDFLALRSHRAIREHVEKGLTEFLLDGEMLPWTYTADILLNEEYAALPAALRQQLALYKNYRQDTKTLEEGLACYIDVVNRFAPPMISGLSGPKFAPFAILAGRGKNKHFIGRSQERCFQTAILEGTMHPRFQGTVALQVNVQERIPENTARAQEFYDNLIRTGKEGVVVKPNKYDPSIPNYLKVRSPEYLSIIFGPGYDAEALSRKNHKEKRKRSQRQSAAVDRCLEHWAKTGQRSDLWVFRGFAAGISYADLNRK